MTESVDVCVILNTVTSGVVQASGRVQVWDFCRWEHVQHANAMCQSLPATSPSRLACAAASACSNGARYTPLHTAAADGHAELLRLLLCLGAPVSARSKSGATALFLACEAGNAAAVRVLLQAGATIWGLTASGENCLYIAALRGHALVCPHNGHSQTLSACPVPHWHGLAVFDRPLGACELQGWATWGAGANQ